MLRVELSQIPGPQETFNIPDDADVAKLLEIADVEIDLEEQQVNVNGEVASLTTRLHNGDSVEVTENTKGN